MAALVQKEALEVYQPELGTAPRVYYKNLYRWTKVFVAGSAYFADSGDCAEGCEVTVTKDGARGRHGRHQQLRRLPGGRAGVPAPSTSVAVKAAGYKPVEHKAVPTAASLTLPAVALEKA